MGSTWEVESYREDGNTGTYAWRTELRTEVLTEAIEEMGRLHGYHAGAIRLTWRPQQ